MPELPVRSNADRSRKPRRAEPSGRLLQRLRRWPRRRIVLAGVIAIATTGIAVNALVLQSARHPAPLFAAVEQARRAAPPAARAIPAPELPLPPVRPLAEAPPAPPPPAAVPSDPLARLAAEAVEKPIRPSPAERPAPQPARPAPQPKVDPLADIIRGGIVPPAGIPSEPDPRVQQAQRSLARLGNASVKPDGFMGPATKAAIEKFERERKWPVTGEISPRLIRELGVVSASRP